MNYLLSIVIVLAGILALYALWNLYCNVSELNWYIALALALIVALIPVPAVMISLELYKDQRAKKIS
jgi:dolichyl-phosphate-mannose--protein O-mannosyl transferase